MTELNKFYARDNSEYGGEMRLTLLADSDTLLVRKEHQKNCQDYPDDEDIKFSNFYDAWTDYSRKVLDCPYKSGWWDCGAERKKALRVFQNSHERELVDDLENMTVEEIVPEEQESVEKEPQLDLGLENEKLLNPTIKTALEGLKSTAEKKIEGFDAQITEIKARIAELEGQRKEQEDIIKGVEDILCPAPPETHHKAYPIADDGSLITPDKLGDKLGIPRRRIYKAISLGVLVPRDRVKGGKILLDEEQQKKAVEYFSGQIA